MPALLLCTGVCVCGLHSFTVVEPPPELVVAGAGGILQARASRVRPKARSAEDSAVAVGEGVPYLEYSLHSALVNKMRLRGANAIFDLRVQVPPVPSAQPRSPLVSTSWWP